MIDARNWRDLIRPKALIIDQESLSDQYGKFTCEPLERGFGITIGNSLRRVLLSSLQGAAITAVKVDGALHEFTTINDVVEDVTDIVLNLKEVVVKCHKPKPQIVRPRQGRPGPVTGGRYRGQRACRDPQPRASYRDPRQGWSDAHGADHHRPAGATCRPISIARPNEAIGVIPIDGSVLADSQSQLHRHQRSCRSGDDYDKLTLEVWTNGTVRPEDAVAYAAKILKEQLTIFINFEEEEEAYAEPSTRR